MIALTSGRSGLIFIIACTASVFLLGPHVYAQDGPTLAVDAGIEGNEPDAVGPIEDCFQADAGDEFQMDVVVENITDLLAWQIYLTYDPAVLTVTDHDVKLFQQANAGSAVFDLSAAVPDNSGRHSLAAFDSADPPQPDSGSGVLARVTLRAVGEGGTEVGFDARDVNNDGVLDVGTLLRDIDAQPIGDENGDSYFDGEAAPALVVVGGECPAGSNVVTFAGAAGEDGGIPWLVVGGVIIAVLAAAAAGALVLLSRRNRSRQALAGED